LVTKQGTFLVSTLFDIVYGIVVPFTEQSDPHLIFDPSTI